MLTVPAIAAVGRLVQLDTSKPALTEIGLKWAVTITVSNTVGQFVVSKTSTQYVPTPTSMD